MTNRLADQISPYLLQHAGNPVHWYPWGPEALQQAKTEEKPIFLSIGYSACHWCHVMAHESFEDKGIARFLNEHFVSIKVDREERPDLDQIYMNAVQMITGRGGWPMSVFLTPGLEPFFGGTYWPPTSRMGLPGFQQVLEAVADAWSNRRQQTLEQAAQLTAHLQKATEFRGPETSSEMATPDELLDRAAAKLEQTFDRTHGGFGTEPKFPHPIDLQLLLRIWHRRRHDTTLHVVRRSLDMMARGGIYDHLAGGFARYSVDRQWLVPHFEKMLYDNALLANAYLDGLLVTKDPQYERITRETLDYVLDYMTDPQGGFHSTEDADSEGVEGKFYVWTPAQIRDALGDARADRFCRVYGVTEQGNFEGRSILHLPRTIQECALMEGWDLEELNAELAGSRTQLRAVRDRRVRPGKDDKILASWNGLMIDALARAAAVFGSHRYLQAATRAAQFVQDQMADADGRLLHVWRGGQARLPAYLDDYACLANGLVTLYEASFDEHWMDEAVGLADAILKRFRDTQRAGFFYTADDHEKLIVRNKDLQDSAVPSGNAMAATALLRLGSLCGRVDYRSAALEAIDEARSLMDQFPTAAGQMLVALDMQREPLSEIVILGDLAERATAEVLSDLRARYLPNRVVACRPQADVPDGSVELDPIFVGRQRFEPSPTVYICEKFACAAPVRGKEAAIVQWEKMS